MIRLMGILIGLAVISLGAYMLYYQLTTPKKVLGYSQVKAKSQKSGREVEVRTRRVEQGGNTFWEVELSRGAWTPCGVDCAETYRREKLDMWDVQKEEKR